MDSNITSRGMVQSAYQKCLELHDFVPIFLNFSQTPPLFLVFLMVCFANFSHIKNTHMVCFLGVFGGQNTPPPFSCWKAKKKKKKCGPPPLSWNPGSATVFAFSFNLTYIF